jgi:hypothetical protein
MLGFSLLPDVPDAQMVSVTYTTEENGHAPSNAILRAKD